MMTIPLAPAPGAQQRGVDDDDSLYDHSKATPTVQEHEHPCKVVNDRYLRQPKA